MRQYVVEAKVFVEANSEEQARRLAMQKFSNLPDKAIKVHEISEAEESGEKITLIVTHRNVDMDAIASSILYVLRKLDIREMSDTMTFFGMEHHEGIEFRGFMVTTEEFAGEIIEELYDELAKIVVLDMEEKKLEEFEKYGLPVEHYDHHDGSAPSTARVLWEKLKDELPEWAKFLVELADYSDTGQVLKQPAPLKYFHLTGYINALKTRKVPDVYVFERVFWIILEMTDMLKKLVEAEKQVEDIPIYDFSGVKVAIVEDKPHTVNQTLFENGVSFIVYRDGNNIGIIRNAVVDEPDLNELKEVIRNVLKVKNAESEFDEWFFHPMGFLVARGTRKHPAKTPSALTTQDLLNALASIL